MGPSGRLDGRGQWAVVAGALALLAVGTIPPSVAAAPAQFTKATVTFPVTVGPNDDQHCNIVGDLYVPRDASAARPVPAILTTNGFGGSKDDQAGLGAYGASNGYEVLSYSGLGFGGSGCNIELDDPDWDGKAASQLITFLGNRPEVKKDRPGDPRVGMIGGSYGGGVQFATASIDSRLDTIVPIITWNDLSYSLTPNNDAPNFVYAASPPGVPKIDWTELFFADGASEPLQHVQSTPKPTSTCPGFDARVCPANVTSGARSYPDDTTIAFLRHASAASFMAKIRIPTMLMQGEADTLFNINEAAANYRGIKANGAPVKLVLQSWGHSNSTPAPGEFDDNNPPSSYEGRLIVSWFDHYLKGLPVATGPEVEYFRDWVPYPSTGTAAPAYGQAPSWPTGTPMRLYLSGTTALVTAPTDVQAGEASIVNPPGGQPSSYSETSGVQTMQPFASIPPSDPPAEVATWSTPALGADTDVVGTPTLDAVITAAAPVGGDPAADPVLFAKLYDVAPDGSVGLVQRLVSPVRIGAAGTNHINLPGVVHRYAKGHRMMLALATTDAAYVSSRVANVVRVATSPGNPAVLTVPVIAGATPAPTSTPLPAQRQRLHPPRARCRARGAADYPSALDCSASSAPTPCDERSDGPPRTAELPAFPGHCPRRSSRRTALALQQLWWEEAEHHQVLPLNNQPGRFGDRRFGRYAASGPVLARATFQPTGRFQGDLELWYGDVPVGRGHIAHTTPITYGVEPFSIEEQRMTPIAPALEGRAALPPGVLDHVVIEAVGAAYRDPQGEQRAALAIQ